MKKLLPALVLISALPVFCQQTDDSENAGYLELQQKIEQAELKMIPAYRLLPEDIEALEALSAEISATFYQDLIIRSQLLMVLSAQKRFLQDGSQDEANDAQRLLLVEQALSREAETLKRSRFLKVSLGTGIASLGLSSLLWLLSEWTDYSWTTAETLEQARRWDAWSDVFAWGSYFTMAVSLASFGVSIPFVAGLSPTPSNKHPSSLPAGDD